MDIKRYKNNAEYSYTLGMALTIELIKHKRNQIRGIFVHPNYTANDAVFNIMDVCDKAHLPCVINQKIFNRLSNKDNVYVIGVFDKYESDILPEKPHIMLVNPSDSGNLGTIIRTGLGFGFKDYAIIKPGVDIYDPKTIRSSMGALFHVRFQYYDSFDCYKKLFKGYKIYSFMLDGKIDLKDINEIPQNDNYTLVFGNEATGLPEYYHDFGETVFIPHSDEIDSLNLSVAFGIAANAFANYK